MKEDSLLKLDAICRKRNVILLFARSYGLMGLIRISVKVTFFNIMFDKATVWQLHSFNLRLLHHAVFSRTRT